VDVFPILSEQIIDISAATNASPIEITTDEVHDLATGDEPEVRGVAGNTNANGTRAVTVTTTTKFTIDNTAGNADHLPAPSGQVIIDRKAKWWDADTTRVGAKRQFPLMKHDDKVMVQVEAENDPSGGGTDKVDVRLYGRAGNGDWCLIDTIDDADTWTEGPDGAGWCASSVNLQKWPEMQLRIAASATSTNTVRAWLVA
jgi:hypothetical protein